MTKSIALFGMLFISLCSVDIGAEVRTEILTESTSSWDGGSFHYPINDAKITVQKISISTSDKEISLAMHCHSMPLAAYVLKGSVKVVKPSGRSMVFKEGDAFIEVMNQWHKGVFIEDTQLIVFYAGNKRLPLSLVKGAENTSNSCDKR